MWGRPLMQPVNITDHRNWGQTHFLSFLCSQVRPGPVTTDPNFMR